MLFAFDLETTGLPDRAGYDEYYPYQDITRYASSRIVSFSAIVFDNIQDDNIKIHDFILKPTDFVVAGTEFHGITHQHAVKVGLEFQKIIDIVETEMIHATCIYAHNIQFDINILQSELCRYNRLDLATKLSKVKLCCTMAASKNQVGALNKWGKIKNPSLKETYTHFYPNLPCTDLHNGLADTKKLHQIIKKL